MFVKEFNLAKYNLITFFTNYKNKLKFFIIKTYFQIRLIKYFFVVKNCIIEINYLTSIQSGCTICLKSFLVVFSAIFRSFNLVTKIHKKKL